MRFRSEFKSSLEKLHLRHTFISKQRVESRRVPSNLTSAREAEKRMSGATASTEVPKPTKQPDDQSEKRKRKLYNHRNRPNYFTANSEKVVNCCEVY